MFRKRVGQDNMLVRGRETARWRGCLPVVARHLRRVGLRRVFTANSQKRSEEIACIGDIKKERHWSDLPLLPAGRTRARQCRSRAHLGFRSVHVERALRDVCARKLCMNRDPECQAETREEKSRSLMSSSANGARGKMCQPPTQTSSTRPSLEDEDSLESVASPETVATLKTPKRPPNAHKIKQKNHF
jgi:hypothetical protein